MSARNLRSLSYFLALVALMGIVGCAVSLRRRRMISPLTVAQAAHARWIARPDNAEASEEYHRSVRRLVEWFDSLPEAQRREVCREAELAVELDPTEETGLCLFTPADKVPLHRLRRRHTRSGIGVPVVAWRPNDGSGQWDALRPPEGITAPATAILERGTDNRQWTLRFLSPDHRETVTMEGRSYPLAANFTAPTAMIVRQAEPLRRSGFRGMLNAPAIKRREKLYLMQPYDPNRTPLLMVHGLQSTPVSFANLVNDLFADPALRSRYQLWHYHYPTGTPVLQNAAVLRRVLKQTLREIDPQGSDFATNNLVVLGHSMGGIMTHTLISDSGYKLWDSVFSVRPETFSCDLKTSRVINAIYLFERERRVRRAILIAVPHRGSSIADNWIGDLGQTLYRADSELQEAFRSLVESHRDQINPYLLNLVKEGKISSIRTLSAKSPAMMALACIPPAVPFHNIIGQRTSGPAHTGNDGVVTYSSSHLDGAESELIVRYGHEAFLHPEAVAEIKRILHAHLESL